MKTLASLKQKPKNKLSLAQKILVRRLYADLGRPFSHLAERFQNARTLPPPPSLPRWTTAQAIAIAENKLSKRAADRPIRTSIIIPVYNKVDFTFHCLRTLLNEIDLNTTEVIIVNNASTDETPEMLSYFENIIRVFDNEKNEGFVDACNKGAALARGAYLVFLNNDTAIQSGWLDNLLGAIEDDPTVGAVGSMFLYPDGKIQEAGAIVWKSGEAYHYGWGKSADDRRYNFAREVDYCSAASLLIRRDLFESLGGFDRRYAPAYYEDVDLCFGVRSQGYKVIYQPGSRVVHYEGVTAGRNTAVGTKHYQIINQEKFYHKWRDVLERSHFEKDFSLAEQASNRKRGPRFLVIDDRVPMPDRDAGSGRMFHILRLLANLGRPVFVSLKALPEYEKLLWKEGIETANVADYHHLLKKRGFSVAILSRPEVASALFKSVRRVDREIKIIFDMVDAYFIRLGRQHRVTGDPNLGQESRRYEQLEIDLAVASDQVWCNSSEDKRVVSEHVPAPRIVVIPTIHKLHDRGKPFAERNGVLFIGHLSHSPNSDAVHYFMQKIFPLVKESLPSIFFHIVGSSASAEIRAYDSETVKVMGYIPDIDPLFQSARVFVAPMRFGAGTKGKIGDALSYGLPVVTTSIGAEGFGLTSGDEVMIADEPQEFANSILRLYREPELWHRLADRGYRHVENHFTPQVIGKTIEAGLHRLGVLNA